MVVKSKDSFLTHHFPLIFNIVFCEKSNLKLVERADIRLPESKAASPHIRLASHLQDDLKNDGVDRGISIKVGSWSG